MLNPLDSLKYTEHLLENGDLILIVENKGKSDVSATFEVEYYNEENTVAIVVDVIKKVPCVDEVIVVDDGSSDNTAQEATKAGAIVISHEVNKGKGEALYTGYKNAECDIIAFIKHASDIFSAGKAPS